MPKAPAPRAKTVTASGTSRKKVRAPAQPVARPATARSRPASRPSVTTAVKASNTHVKGLTQTDAFKSKRQWKFAFATGKPWAHAAARKSRPYKSLPRSARSA